MNILNKINEDTKSMLGTKEEFEQAQLEREYQNHDCHKSPDDSCDTCIRYWESKNQRSENNK